jgi:arylsulfatase A-like enzyme
MADPFATIAWRKRLAARLRRWGLLLARPLQPSRSRASSGPPNLLVLAIDTLRWDHLGLAGRGHTISPVLDSLAAGGTLFTDVTAPAPWTLPSFASSLTGLAPTLHRAVLPGPVRNMDTQPPHRLAAEVPTLASHLQRHGYRTAAFYSNPFFAFGLAESFSRHAYANLPAEELAFLALEWIRRHADRPFFCFVLFNDPHEPTTPAARFLRPRLQELAGRGVTASRRQVRDLARWGDESRGPHLGRSPVPPDAATSTAREIKLALYDATIAQVDATVGRVLDRLTAWGLAEQTLVSVFADHGEEFLDHLAEAHRWHHDPRSLRAIGHGHTLFQELLHVPWLASGPGVPPGRRHTAPVSLCDVAPTLADWLGMPGLDLPPPPLPGLIGRSLLPVLGGPPPGPAAGLGDDSTAAAAIPPGPTAQVAGSSAQPPVLSEEIAYGPDLVAVRQGAWKLISTRLGQPLALYDLDADPGEQIDRRQEQPRVLEQLRRIVVKWAGVAADSAGRPGGDWQDISGTVRRRLRDLGYTD